MNHLRNFKRKPRRQKRANLSRAVVEEATADFLKSGGEITRIAGNDSYQLANHLTPKTPQHFLNSGGPTRKNR